MPKPTEPTAEMLAKLPLWAQMHIKDLAARQEMAYGALKTFQDGQTPTGVFYETHVRGTAANANQHHAKCYVPAEVLHIEHGDVELRVSLVTEDTFAGPLKSIALAWSSPKRVCAHIALVPTSFQAVSLFSKNNLRE